MIGHAEEGAGACLLFFLAEFLEDYAEEKAHNSIKSLLEIAPNKAKVLINGNEKVMDIKDVNINDTVIVRPGDKVPLDGIVSKGVSTIDQAPITGESLPVTKNIGEEVFAGTINQEGYLEINVNKESSDTVIAKIVKLVEESKFKRSNTERNSLINLQSIIHQQ